MKKMAAIVGLSTVLFAFSPAAKGDTVPVSSNTEVPIYWDSVNNRLGIGTPSPADSIHVEESNRGICDGNHNIKAIRIVNPGLSSCPDAQEQFVLGPAGQEHVMLQVLSDVNPAMPKVALVNAVTHDLFIRTNTKNVIKAFNNGSVEDTLVLKAGLVGVGTAVPSNKLHVAGDSIRIDTPRTGTGNCNVGEITWDTGYIYVCVQANTWKKAQLQ